MKVDSHSHKKVYAILIVGFLFFTAQPNKGAIYFQKLTTLYFTYSR